MLLDCSMTILYDHYNDLKKLTMLKHQDILWKGIIEDLCDDFILFFFHEASKEFDFTKGFEFLDKELIQLFPETENNPKFVDKLVKVHLKTGEESWILVHVEVQGYQEVNFEHRMFIYYYRILEKHNKPITALAIFTDEDKNYHPKEYVSDYLGTKLSYRFNTYKVMDQDEEELSKSQNIFSQVILTVLIWLKNRKKGDDILYDKKLKIASDLMKRAYPKNKVRSMMNFINLSLNLKRPELNSNFYKEISVLTGNKEFMGLEELIKVRLKEEGREEGREEGMEKGREAELIIAINNMTKKSFSDQDIMDLLEISTDKLTYLRNKL